MGSYEVEVSRVGVKAKNGTKFSITSSIKRDNQILQILHHTRITRVINIHLIYDTTSEVSKRRKFSTRQVCAYMAIYMEYQKPKGKC